MSADYSLSFDSEVMKEDKMLSINARMELETIIPKVLLQSKTFLPESWKETVPFGPIDKQFIICSFPCPPLNSLIKYNFLIPFGSKIYIKNLLKNDLVCELVVCMATNWFTHPIRFDK